MELLIPDIFNNLLHFIGGPKHIDSLLEPLESLSTREEPTIREKALEIMKSLVITADIRRVEESIMKIAINLLHGEWFTSKNSGLKLAIFLYSLDITDSSKDQIENEIVNWSKDTIFHVRKAVGTSLYQLADLIPNFPKSKVVSITQDLSKDISDVVRTECIEGLIHLCEVIKSKDLIENTLFVIIIKSFEDTAWRIRKQWIESFDKLLSILNKSGVDTSKIWTAFIKFFQDPESQIKEAAIAKIPQILELVEDEWLNSDLVPIIEKLANDDSVKVRRAIGENTLWMWEVIGKEASETIFVPLFKGLIHDNDKTVKMAVMSHLGTLCKIIKIEDVKDDIVECCNHILESNDWRERSSLISQFPSFAKILGKDNFTAMYLDIIKEWLSDRVYFVRKETINIIKELSNIFGIEWFCKNVLDYLYAFKSDQNYLHRERLHFLLW